MDGNNRAWEELRRDSQIHPTTWHYYSPCLILSLSLSLFLSLFTLSRLPSIPWYCSSRIHLKNVHQTTTHEYYHRHNHCYKHNQWKDIETTTATEVDTLTANCHFYTKNLQRAQHGQSKRAQLGAHGCGMTTEEYNDESSPLFPFPIYSLILKINHLTAFLFPIFLLWP